MEPYYTGLQFGIEMDRNPQVKLGNIFLTVYKDKRTEYIIPEYVRRKNNKIAVTNGEVYLNGYWLDQKHKDWVWTFKAWVISLVL